jgi:hypothetical protein
MPIAFSAASGNLAASAARVKDGLCALPPDPDKL